EEDAEDDAGADPEEAAEAIPEEEGADGLAHGAGERRRDGAETGDEFGVGERRHPRPLEEVLGAAHAGVRREGEPADRAQHPVALPAADEEPDRVGQERGEERHDQEGRQIEPSASGEGAGDDQRRKGWDRHAELLQEDIGEDDEQAVLDEAGDDLFHAVKIPAGPRARQKGQPPAGGGRRTGGGARRTSSGGRRTSSGARRTFSGARRTGGGA